MWLFCCIKAFHYPEEAGYPIGGTDGKNPEYYMLEVHYDNPGLGACKCISLFPMRENSPVIYRM